MTSKKTGYLLGAVAGAGVMAAAVAGAGMRIPSAWAEQSAKAEPPKARQCPRGPGHGAVTDDAGKGVAGADEEIAQRTAGIGDGEMGENRDQPDDEDVLRAGGGSGYVTPARQDSGRSRQGLAAPSRPSQAW